ncbi:sulfotransferase [Nocardiopsis lucentensis]|uniref:sulfotransferase n=1 Tax=Nocardiopsis lucentensis TaxID=53441 RepID=UPI00034DECF5|nr:sulfotransferase [Nocardiopsis lucentensis]
MKADLLEQLHHPDPIGVDLALFRTRMYRFSEDRRQYVLAEVLEERFIEGRVPRRATQRYVTACLNSIRSTGAPPAFEPDIPITEGIDVDAELRARRPFVRSGTEAPVRPQQVVCVLGAPRSGTSHLYNLLARRGRFAYFTTVTCWAWPVRNLGVPQRRLFESMPGDVLLVDNKSTRIIPGLVMPYEAEDVYARALPTYRHLAGHTYEILPAELGDERLLRDAISAHTRVFGRPRFLTKSPFNAFRVHQFEQLFGPIIRYIHIERPRAQVAESLARNRFAFRHDGRELTGEEAYDLFSSAILANVPRERYRSVTLESLRMAPEQVVAELLAWIDSEPDKE